MAQNRWTADEVHLLVEDYLDMLDGTLRGDRINKAEHYRALMGRLNGRTKGSVEMKYQNVSAVLVALDLDYLDGYVPLRNYERKILPDIVNSALAARPDLIALLKYEAARLPIPLAQEPFPQEITVVGAPKGAAAPRAPKRAPGTVITPPKEVAAVAQAEAANHELGRAGEEAVVEFERRRLHDLGQPDLSKKVRHVALDVGDGLGYDVASFDANGTPRLIEVKTTRRGAMTPFFLSPNEIAVSKRERDRFYLYRVFRFDIERSMYQLRGDLEKSCRLQPTAYRASVA